MEVLVHCADDVGESPVWDDRHGCLRWVDLLAGTVRSITQTGVLTQVRAGCAVGAIGLTDTDDLIAAVRAGFARISPAGRRTVAEVGGRAAPPHERRQVRSVGRLRRGHDARRPERGHGPPLPARPRRGGRHR